MMRVFIVNYCVFNDSDELEICRVFDEISEKAHGIGRVVFRSAKINVYCGTWSSSSPLKSFVNQNQLDVIRFSKIADCRVGRERENNGELLPHAVIT